ncbi:hybrid sensor histidine kinase/response regulator [Pedobacter duraquae]|uniref:histidine kinase n=1 Tax=Pedobacter duraquae TaxID=425511 RepID=A0A4R6IEW9_9SPHI|nr:hybrid sensor histidine kinase/response regulator [Pedobacter duraquae]TDO20177.1 signal transduction histidine kinase [Pedobacter duraquae]
MGQYVFKEGTLPAQVSLTPYAKIADIGLNPISFTEVQRKSAQINFMPIKDRVGNLGFTNHIYWVRFQIQNHTLDHISYYLETAEPVTDIVNLYGISNGGAVDLQRSGDKLDFSARALPFNATLFRIKLAPAESKTFFMEVRNDGEKNTLPIELMSPEMLLKKMYQEQLIMGLFYGVLLIIVVTYFFFYFALKEYSFLYYALYVFSLIICHAALDGFLHQYVTKDNSWLNLHAVILSAIAGSYFFGKYSELILNIKVDLPIVYRILQGMYLLLGTITVGVIFIPSFLSYTYPIVNIITLFGMVIIGLSVVVRIIKQQKTDLFFSGGLLILFVCFFLVILRNFGINFPTFLMDNISKIGIGLQIISLSLSMANRIWVMKVKEKELHAIALQRAEEMNDVKSFFMSNMSHELRTPLNAIVGLTNIIDQETKEPATSANLQLIRSASDSLISSLDDIFDFAKIEKGELQLDQLPFLLAPLMEKVSRRFTILALEKNLDFKTDFRFNTDIQVIGDPLRLEQILNNILSNAIKFTVHGGVLFSVSSKIDEQHKLTLDIVITDTGIGIVPEKLDAVFEAFSQVEATNTRRFGGFGIGLSIVKTLIDRKKGKITIQSKLGVGTTCSISLVFPVTAYPAAVQNRFPQNRYDLLGSKILVVEDNKMNQMVLKMMFSKWGGTTASFADHGADALEQLLLEEIDLVLMDLQMPVMDGYEATAAIRGGKAGDRNIMVPIIALTADLMDSTKNTVFELGVNDFMTKPVDQKTLYEKITSLLS